MTTRAALMMALTIQQPWAWAIAERHKLIENRTWTTGYRGPLAIHAGKAWDEGGEAACADILTSLGLLIPAWPRSRWPRGAVVAVAELHQVCALSAETFRDCDCGPWAVQGQYHWQLRAVRPLTTPYEVRGRQGLWPITLPVPAVAP